MTDQFRMDLNSRPRLVRDIRVTFGDLTPNQQQAALLKYRSETGDTDPDDVVVEAVFEGFDWDSSTGRPWDIEQG